MRSIRRVLGVILGYVIFATSAGLFFKLAGRNPHAVQDVPFMIGSIFYGMLFAALGGYLSAAVGGRHARAQGAWVGVIIAIGATASLLASRGTDSRWSMLGALALMAPSALLGGTIRGRQNAAEATDGPGLK